MNIHSGFSADGIDWQIEEQPIVFAAEDPRVAEIRRRSSTPTTRG